MADRPTGTARREPAGSPPQSPRRTKNRVRDRQLSRDEIIEAALELSKRVGMENMTMRDLANELDVTPMAAYYWVKNKRELTQLVSEAFQSDWELPPPSVGPWYERLRALYREVHAHAVRFPGSVAPRREVYLTKANQLLLDDQLEMLVKVGFPPERAIVAVDLLNSYLIGRSTLTDAFRSQGWRPQVTKELSAAGRRLRETDLFEQGLDLIIEGLRRDLRAHKRAY
jgi:AcrR family transcriptional regulator